MVMVDPAFNRLMQGVTPLGLELKPQDHRQIILLLIDTEPMLFLEDQQQALEPGQRDMYRPLEVQPGTPPNVVVLGRNLFLTLFIYRYFIQSTHLVTRLARQARKQGWKLFRKAIDMIDDRVVVCAEDALYVLIRIGIKGQAVTHDALGRQLFYRLLRV